jgi:ubiquitin carboxyl-terminal hydrolase 9/24
MEGTEEDDDYFLRGLLTLLRSVFRSMRKNGGLTAEQASAIRESIGLQQSLIHEVFENCLFALPSRELKREWSETETTTQGEEEKKESSSSSLPQSIFPPPKCKSSASRSAAFSLLVELSREHGGCFSEVTRLLASHHSLEPMEEPSAKGTASSKSNKRSIGSSYITPKSKSGYAGLKNLGCICYMNATLQQFAMIPEFVEGIMKFETETVDAFMDNADISEDSVKDDLMYQFQLLLVDLQETERAYANPTGLCYAFKDWDGAPVNPMIQQDSSEFLGNFFMQIENLTMGSDAENVLRDVFGGTLSNELLADGGRYSERSEPFNFFSVSVQGHSRLEEGLQDFISGSTVDYAWEDEDDLDENGKPRRTSLPTTKQTSLKELPHHLIIHLKRFEFNFDTM